MCSLFYILKHVRLLDLVLLCGLCFYFQARIFWRVFACACLVHPACARILEVCVSIQMGCIHKPMYAHAYFCPENPNSVLFAFSFVFFHMFNLCLISFVLSLNSYLSVVFFSLFTSLMLVRVFDLFIYMDMHMI